MDEYNGLNHIIANNLKEPTYIQTKSKPIG